jgi:hypothetical protein
MKKCLDFWVEGSKLEIRDKNPMIGKANRNLGKKKPATEEGASTLRYAPPIFLVNSIK